MSNISTDFWQSKEVLKQFPELYCALSGPTLNAAEDSEYTEIMATWSTGEQIASKSQASFSCCKPAGMIGIELYNVTQNRIMKTEYVNGNDIRTLQAVMSSGKNAIENGEVIETRTHFIWANPDGTVGTADRTISSTSNLNAVIESNTVEAPRARDKKLTIVLYGREPVSPEIEDYKYPENKKKDNKVKAMLPVKGSVRLNSQYTIQEILLTGEHAPKLNMILSSGQAPPTYKKDFSKAIQILDEQNISYEFETDWGDEIDVSRFNASTIVDVHMDFTIRAKYFGMDVYITIVVTSLDDTSLAEEISSPATQIIEQVSIRWGCLGKDTRIQMADGSQRCISDIRIGDQVSTPNGLDTVHNIFTGEEEYMVYIKTYNGKILLTTGSHPIFTKRGIVTADKLNGGDVLIIQDGEDSIAELFEYPYHNRVYSLELTSQNQFYAEGILVGDFKLQNTATQKDNTPVWSDNAKLMQSHIKEFAKALRKQQEE